MNLNGARVDAAGLAPTARWSKKRKLAMAVGVAVATLVTTACGSWGIKTSYRSYIKSSVAAGTITATDGASWADGPGAAKGPFTWSIESSQYNSGTGKGYVQFKGTVVTTGHATAGGNLLDLTVSNPRLEIDGDDGTLVADLNYRPFIGFGPTVAPLQAATDVDFASVDLSAVNWTPASNGLIAISGAPMTGLPAAMQRIGWDQFYGDNIGLDSLSVNFSPSAAPKLATTPTVKVSKTSGLHFGDQITVWGTGFDPNANTGTRPPLAGQKSGDYVIFGKFAANWKPSAGAPSTNRTLIQQRWALPAASRAVLDPTSNDPAFVTIDQYGRFEATLTLTENAAAGSYGVYVYAGGGAVNAAHELAVLTGVS